MKKRGQVTIFIVIGIAILFAFAGILYLVQQSSTKEVSARFGETPLIGDLRPQITNFVESCIENIAVPGIYLLGIQGGVIYPDDPTKLLITENSIINYGYLNGINQLSTKDMEEQLNRYMEESLPECLDFSVFESQGIVVEEKSDLNMDTKIVPNEVIFSLNYDLELTSGEAEMSVESFIRNVPLKLGNVVTEANSLIEKQKENPDQVARASQLNYFTSFFPYDFTTYVYSISDDNSIIDGAPLTFMFAIDSEFNTAPELDYVSDQVLQKGQTFTYQLFGFDHEKDLMTFSSDNPEFQVDDTGLISFTPQKIGVFTVTFTVKDTGGLTGEQKVRFSVEE